EVKVARPLNELLPPDTPSDGAAAEIDRQVQRLIPLVHRDLQRAGVPTRIYWMNDVYDPKKQALVPQAEDEVGQDLIWDYFRLRHAGSGEIMTKLNQGIGVYEELLRTAKWELVNPLAWIAHVLYAP